MDSRVPSMGRFRSINSIFFPQTTNTTMKKILLTTALALGMGASASAISIDWGITAGLNLTKVSYNAKENVIANNLKNKAGYFIGPKVNIGILGGFGVDGALLYSQHGLQMINKEYREDAGTDSHTMHAIEIPINLKYTFGVGKTGVYVSTGPQFGFNVTETKAEFGSIEKTFSNQNMITSWNVGAGVKLLGHLDLGIGYNFALGKTGEFLLGQLESAVQAGIPRGAAYNYKTNTFTAQVTYYF